MDVPIESMVFPAHAYALPIDCTQHAGGTGSSSIFAFVEGYIYVWNAWYEQHNVPRASSAALEVGFGDDRLGAQQSL